MDHSSSRMSVPSSVIPGGSLLRSDLGSTRPSYLPPDGSVGTAYHSWNADNYRSTSEFFRNDPIPPRPAGYAAEDIVRIGSQAAPGYVGLATGAVSRGYSPLEDPSKLGRSALFGIKPFITDNGQIDSFKRSEGLFVDESNILFVDGLPSDCTRREVAHLFRPFIGFKEIRVVHKEPRRVGDKARVLCFVEFDSPKCALTALQALQGYKFDDQKPETPVLSIQFAKFPFRLPNVDKGHGVAQPTSSHGS
ncbi:hypothetical protein HPP92_011471 [Vanilla planifolia]|uniref:RRM domain-containing protein n=1 Tax=Vanilla planifolia TaxID=51239 RepID=A0A835QZ53_VANPL|nr:hypothetical protein HPP92_011471 [Vanilla planifolia]